VVHRELTLTRGWLGAIATLLGVATLLGAATAEAANRRVAIGDYRWSLSEIHLDRGEHVTWYWVGPDTMHSVTGTSPDAAGLDSDPNESTPSHQLGDSFQLSFDRPGTYTFQCRLHSSVRGTVFVSSKPGDPVTEVDPIPRPNFDLRPPHMNDVRLQERAFGRRGTTLRLGIDERSKIDADYYRLRHGRRSDFAGWRSWRAHVGYNEYSFASRGKHFGARPGRYVAIIRATDTSHNTGPRKLRKFTIR
jgi:plastocyanin